MEKAKLIKEYAAQIGFDLCGITSAEPFSELAEYLHERARQGMQSEFESYEIAKRIEPRLVLPEARSIIALGKAYPVCTGELSENPGRGKLARACWGTDYHLDFKERMEAMVQFLQKDLAVTVALPMADTGPLIDRAVAARAGLGWYGKNCSIISPGFGSWIALGEIVVNIDLANDEPLRVECGRCQKCLKACPTGALFAPYRVNPALCLSQLTQTKAIIPEKYRKLLGNRLYGCDTCQEACPKNKGINGDQAWIKPHETEIEAKDLLALTNSQFLQKYGSTAFSWRGKNILQRNAVIALGNAKSAEAVPLLKEALFSPNSGLRGYSAWALGQVGTGEAMDCLKEALTRENDPWAREEINSALKN